MSEKEFCVYGLYSPRSKYPSYIGSAYDENGRLNSHLAEAKRGKKTAKCDWIRSLLGDGILPQVKILKLASSKREAHRLERTEIHNFSKLTILTNIKIPSDKAVNDKSEWRFASVKLKPSEYAKIERIAKAEDRTISFILRRMIDSLKH